MLIAILMPTVGAVRRQARAAICLSNVRQINTAFTSYRTANMGRGIAYRYADCLWIKVLKKDAGAIDQVRLCPEAEDPTVSTASLPYGTATTAWGPGTGTGSAIMMGAYTGSYAINGWLYLPGTSDPLDMPTFFASPANKKSLIQMSDPDVKASETPTFADSIWVDGWPHWDNSPPTDLDNPAYGSGSGTGNMNRFCMNRHNKRMSVAFLDGSARPVPLAELWQLRWTRDWKPRTVTVP